MYLEDVRTKQGDPDNRRPADFLIGQSYDAANAAVFASDRLVRAVRSAYPPLPDKTLIAAYDDTSNCLHHCLWAELFIRRIWDRYNSVSYWPFHKPERTGADPASYLSDILDLKQAIYWYKAACKDFLFGAKEDPNHWCHVDLNDYDEAFHRVSKGIDTAQRALEYLEQRIKLSPVSRWGGQQ
jgi:hypothetical protein